MRSGLFQRSLRLLGRDVNPRESDGNLKPPSDEERRFDVLALDYEMAREDERTFANIQVAVASITVILLGAIAAIVSDACAFRSLKDKENCKEIPDIFLAGAPAIPLATLAFVQLLGMVAALRSYYIRAVENELRKYAPSPLTDLAAVGPIGPASYHGLITEVTTLRRGRAGYRVLATMIMLVALGVFGGLTVWLAVHLGGAYRNAMLIGYGAAFLVLIADVGVQLLEPDLLSFKWLTVIAKGGIGRFLTGASRQAEA